MHTDHRTLPGFVLQMRGEFSKFVPTATIASLLLLSFALPSEAQSMLDRAISKDEASAIGRKIWLNECGGSIGGLVSWNAGEEFASLGIGHFIWYPNGIKGPFKESFPPLLQYLRGQGVELPPWLTPQTSCPWSSRAEFFQKSNEPCISELRNLLRSTTSLQAEFIIARLRDAESQIVACASPANKMHVQENFGRMWSSGARGKFALIDYVNFKGEGILESERYKGEGWGLLQVLDGMSSDGNAVDGFVQSARRVLTRRVRNSPPARHEQRWLPGWYNRVERYRQ